MTASRIIDLVAGAGWLVLVLHGLAFFRRWASDRARNRAIDRVIAAGNDARRPAGPPVNRQQRRAAQRAAKKGAGK